jgi:hypothetical protein
MKKPFLAEKQSTWLGASCISDVHGGCFFIGVRRGARVAAHSPPDIPDKSRPSADFQECPMGRG